MFKIAIFFRKIALPNVFRSIILNSLESDFDEYLICSAFFQEPYRNKKNGNIVGKFSTSNELINALNKAKTSRIIKIYGLYDTAKVPVQFNLFCRNLINSNKNNFSFFRFLNRSHAKIFLAKEKINSNNEISLAIIGSSNLSAGAFSNNSKKNKWNHECDVIFWNSDSELANGIVSKILDNNMLNESIFIASHDETSKVTALDKLVGLEQLILNNSQEYLIS